jgi:subtilisin family serine protease
MKNWQKLVLVFGVLVVAGLVLYLVFFIEKSEPVIDEEVLREINETNSSRVIVFLRDVPSEDISKYQNRTLNRLIKEDFETSYTYETIGGFSGELTSSGLEKLKKDPSVAYIFIDREGVGSLYETVPLIKADLLNNPLTGLSLTGHGETTCIIDSGIDYNHPALGGGWGNKVIGGYRFLDQGGSKQDCSIDPSACYDDHGHGTAVAGIISSTDEIYRGIAPDSKIVVLNVLKNSSDGRSRGWESDFIAAIDWCTKNKAKYNISVISMSIGDGEKYTSPCDNINPIYFNSIKKAVEGGIVFVASAGNMNYSDGIGMPGCFSKAISVGATTKDDQIASYSNRANFMDLLAPGGEYFSRVWTTSIGGGFNMGFGGTSAAAPHVSGVTLLMIQYEKINGREISQEEIRVVMRETGKNVEGFPRIDSLGAIYSLIGCPLEMEGEGTTLSPCMVESCEHLASIIKNPSFNYILNQDIDCSNISNFQPIGNCETGYWDCLERGIPFSGKFYGNNKTISNLRIDANNDYVGLFGFTSEESFIEKLGLENITINGNSYVGGLVGLNYGEIREVYIRGNVSGYSNVGGIVGYSHGDIKNSYTEIKITASSEQVGGIAGGIYEGTISDSYATGIINSSKKSGGIAGYSYGDIKNVYFLGEINSVQEVSGRIVGNNFGNITNAFWFNDTQNPKNCYSQEDCHWLPWGPECTTQIGNEGCTIIQSQNSFYDPLSSIYSGWNFESVWDDVNHRRGLPPLKWQNFFVDREPPLINLTFPLDNLKIMDTRNILFNFSASDNVELKNCSFWSNFSGIWELNETMILIGQENSSYLNFYNLSDNNYIWNVECCDVSNNCDFSSKNYSFQIFYCISNMTNTSWSDWKNLTCAYNQMNQTRNKTKYDINDCGIFQNITYSEFRLVGPIYQNISFGNWTNITCLPNNTMNQTREVNSSDIYSCAPNTTFQEFRNEEYCFYCETNLTNSSWSDWTNLGCVESDMNQTRNLTQFDSNLCGIIENKTFFESRLLESNITSRNLSSWENLSCSANQMNQSKLIEFFDSSNLGCFSNLTEYEFRLVGPIYQNISFGNWTDITCLPDNTMNQTREINSSDIYSCASNITFQEFRSEEYCFFECDPIFGFDPYTENSIGNFFDYCISKDGLNLEVKKYYCEGWLLKNKSYTCPYGCLLEEGNYRGKCAGDGTTLECIPSNTEKDYYKKGNVTAGNYYKEDFCLTESLSDNMGITGQVIRVIKRVPIVGKVIFSESSPVESNKIVKWFCNNNSFDYEVYECPFGCSNGQCLPEVLRPCVESDWKEVLEPKDCPKSEEQNRTWAKINECNSTIGINKNISEIINCTYTPPTCSFIYSNWSECYANNTQNRRVLEEYPEYCEGGNPLLSKVCNYTSPESSSQESQDSQQTPSPDTQEVERGEGWQTAVPYVAPSQGRVVITRIVCRLTNLFNREKYWECYYSRI